MKYLIVNADDFGLTVGVNRAIIEGHLEGIITSATLMANMPAFDEAVELAKSTPSLGVGLHFNITQGRPIADADRVRSLVDESGQFLGTSTALLLRALTGRLRRDEIELELAAQIARMMSSGLAPTHIDTHKHSHAIPIVLDAIVTVAKESAIPAIRRLSQPMDLRENAWSFELISQALGAAALGILCRLEEEKLMRTGLAKTEALYGIARTGLWDRPWLLRLIAGLSHGTSELMCHPGYEDVQLRAAGTRLVASRHLELELLKDDAVAQSIRTHGVELINYGKFK